MLSNKLKLSLLTVCLSFIITGCDSSSGDSGNNENNTNPSTPTPKSEKLSGYLVAPKALNDISPSAVNFSLECPEIPSGYDPLVSQAVYFLDIDGNEVHQTQTDTCGIFSIEKSDVPDTAVMIKTTYANIELFRSIKYFEKQDSTLTPTSLLTKDANYEISSITVQKIDENRDGVDDYDALVFSVIDSTTGKAVLGINKEDISIDFEQQAIAIKNLNSSLSGKIEGTNGTTAMLVMDSSGSMDSTLNFENERLSRYTIAHYAANSFLDNFNNTNNEAGVLAFSSSPYLMNDDFLNQYYTFENSPFNEFNAYGFTKNINSIYMLTDIYDPYTELYSPYNNIPFHPNTKSLFPDLKANYSYYFLSGGTRFYDSVMDAVDSLKNDLIQDKIDKLPESNNRRVIIAFSDGEDNSSQKSAEDAGKYAKDEGIPIYAVGFGVNDRASQKFKEMAELSGGSYKSVSSANDFIGIFQGISTSIRFTYAANLEDILTGSGTIKLTIDDGLNSATKDLVL